IFKNFKYLIIAPLVFILVGAILLATVGFNKSIDFTGGTVARVYIGENIEYEVAKQKIDTVLENNGLVAAVYQLSVDKGENYITVKYKDDPSATALQMTNINEEVVEDLFSAFGYDKEDLQQATYVVGNQRIDASIASQAIVNLFLGVVV